MLPEPQHHTQPFPHFCCSAAFSPDHCQALRALFDRDRPWQRHEGAFYRCFIRDISAEAPPALLRDVVVRMRALTGLPLMDRVQLTAQRMEPGQEIGLHSDRPELGYEFARLVVQLNPGWQPEYGGVLELFEHPDGPARAHVEAGHNQAIGFCLHPRSYHAVTRVSQTRRSVVLNFWHPANSPRLARAVTHLFAEVSFAELPRTLDPLITHVEATLPEEASHLAGLAGVALVRWGYQEATVRAGYRYSAGLTKREIPEPVAPVLLADWIARLVGEPFDLARWQALRQTLAGWDPPPRLRAFWAG